MAPQPDVSYVVMASRLPLRTYRTIPYFLALAASVMRQLERTVGVVGYSLRAQPTSKTFWTLSAWTSEAELGEFVRTMPHLAVMGGFAPTWRRLDSSLGLSPAGCSRSVGKTRSSG